MRLSILSGSFLVATISQVAAQYTNQSAPFALVLLAENNSTLNGSTLSPCHEGAAIEGLCLGNPITSNATIPTYNFNTSIYDTNPNLTIGQNGIITYELQGGNFNLSSPLSLNFNPTTNVGILLFTPGDTDQAVAFDEDGLLNIQGYLDDTTSPFTYETKPYYRWAVCNTYWGYSYTTLTWIFGDGEAQNPSCVSVNVTRVFL